MIDYLFGFYININANNEQNKFEVHISKNGPKIANLWEKEPTATFKGAVVDFQSLIVFDRTCELSEKFYGLKKYCS